MGDLLFSFKSLFRYWLYKEDHYSQHSSFVYEFYSALLQFLKKTKKGDPEIENFRKNLLNNHDPIYVLDLGAGSKKINSPIRTISEITRFSTSGPRFSQLYEFFCRMTPATHVVELGTCVGISTSYLSKATLGTVYTLEGSAELQSIAKKAPIRSNIEYVLGPIAQTLPEVLLKIPQLDFALIDANHSYQGTVGSFYALLPKVHSKSILAVSDIHWSPEMEKAWTELKSCPQVRLTIDFFECGIVFFRNPGIKHHLILDI